MEYNDGKKQRRKTIPWRPENANPNYLTLIKGFVGKELSKMALPVEYNEPLSMLQRQTEELEYSYLLDIASKESDLFKRMALVCVFVISGYSTISLRSTKPFNPLMGETFECDRRNDKGWRSFAEQISHHPPGSALHVEGSFWSLEQYYSLESKLKGTNICLKPTGKTIIKFNDGNTFIYEKLPTFTSLDYLINGGNSKKNGNNLNKNNVECIGQLIITNNSKIKAILTFHPNNKKSEQYFTKQVTGKVLDNENIEKYQIEAFWDKWAKIIKIEGELKSEEFLWKSTELPQNSEKMHNFTQFAIELNEEEIGVAPTDSRRRPDQRLCELGEFGASNRLKMFGTSTERKN
ncbi:Oxysterol-binding protein [Meloidogyne graminicola]|uniref:Oxysterol-binding protein n=1 Tax=Meloidogyne graminicola TaxID=189291 RepID=A0A8S9ZDC4_9BILA|nr:Oxysterol-binding protein [Meloidogyne graminicola]